MLGKLCKINDDLGLRTGPSTVPISSITLPSSLFFLLSVGVLSVQMTVTLCGFNILANLQNSNIVLKISSSKLQYSYSLAIPIAIGEVGTYAHSHGVYHAADDTEVNILT